MWKFARPLRNEFSRAVYSITIGRNEEIEEALEKHSCFYKQDHAGKKKDANKIDPTSSGDFCFPQPLGGT
jgi:hypothetical protein